MKIYVISFIFFTLFLGCSIKNEDNSYFLDRKILSTSSSLKIDTITGFEDEFIYAKEFLVYKDSILVILNRKYKNGYFVEFYNYNDNKVISQLCKYGEGPDEWLSADIDLNENELIVNDYIKSQVSVINVDSLIKNPNFRIKPIAHRVIGAPTAILHKDSFLLENPYYFGDKRMGIYQGTSRFLVTKGEEFYDERLSYKYYTRNVSVNGHIIKNKQANKIIYASMYQSKIEIYDGDLNKIKIIEGPIELEPQYAIENNEISFKNRIPYAFLDYCTDEESFFLTYVGNYLDREHKLNDYPNWILQFDWYGNLKNCYFLDSYILSISKGQQSNVFYVTVLNKDKEPILLKLHK